MTKLSHLCNQIDKTVLRISSILMLFMVILAGVSIFFRYVLRNPLFWGGDVLLSAFIWVIFLGATVASRKSMHIGIDIFTGLMPQKVKSSIEFVVEIILILLFLILIFEGSILVITTTNSRSGGLQLPPTHFYCAFPISFMIMLLYSVDKVVNKLLEFRKGQNK